MATETRKTGRLRGSEAKSRDFEKWGSVCLCVCVCVLVYRWDNFDSPCYVVMRQRSCWGGRGVKAMMDRGHQRFWFG